MLRQRFLLLLVLMMVIAPVWSALGYYSGSLSAELSFEQGRIVSDADNSDHCRHQDEFKTACHASGSCTFHVCGDGGITVVFLFTQAYSAHRYEHFEKSASRSLSFSPEIRPPINSL
ncbi:MAG: hypothetical protein Q7T96_02965 [Methylobacter sp.]|nr:hypothetical protein [Methylobacter sp.]